ncbi:MAG: zinc ribbon domain-containing protein [Chloroflexota bacterium]|nr:zinc ribbon domain-containing protein [Chloroflexota bacterium]
MPIYEYHCENCNRRVSILIQGFQDNPSVECPECGSKDLTRRFSTFRIGKGETYYKKDFYEDILTDNQLVRGLESNDPRALAEWNRKMMGAAGDEVTPEYEDIQGRLQSGESFESVITEAQSAMGMGDTGGESSGGD